MAKQSTIHFHGGAGSVTGSNFIVNTGVLNIMVDCGLTQGKNTCDDTNWSAFPYDPKAIQFLIVTHAHIDHIGRIPRLVAEGFSGKILSTSATKALAGPMLEDAIELLEREAQRCGKKPLYDAQDIPKALSLWETLDYHAPKVLGDEVTLELLNSGHILGSAMAKFTRKGRTLVMTGDLGGGNSPLLPPADTFGPAHYLVMESVYGDRLRGDDGGRRGQLEDAIENTIARGGTLLIPAFSTERTQDLLYEIGLLMAEKRVPSVPVFLDSPLAQKITEAFIAHPEFFNADIRGRLERGENPFSFPELRYAHTAEESRRLHDHKGSKIILAGSGMSNGGRVVGHEKEILPDQNSTLLIVGYQSAGSLGRRLIEGEKTVELFHVKVPVRATVSSLYGYSAHMDGEQLLEFVNKSTEGLEQVFVVQGEPAAAAFLTQRVRDYLGIKAIAPEAGESATIAL